MKIDFRRHGNYGWQMQVNWGTLRFGVPAAQIVFITTESVDSALQPLEIQSFLEEHWGHRLYDFMTS